jgi:hypothetical protein
VSCDRHLSPEYEAQIKAILERDFIQHNPYGYAPFQWEQAEKTLLGIQDTDPKPKPEETLEPEPQAQSNIIDFTTRLKERQEQNANNQDIERFKRDYLPYMDESDRNLLSSAPDEGKSLILGLICMRIDAQRSRG